MDDGSLPVTRLSTTEVAAGWTNCTEAPCPIEKPRQLMMALSVPWLMTCRPASTLRMVADPPATVPPVGSCAQAGAALSAGISRLPQPMRASARTSGSGRKREDLRARTDSPVHASLWFFEAESILSVSAPDATIFPPMRDADHVRRRR